MIRIDIPWLVFLWLLVFLCGILFVWAVVELSRRRSVRQAMRHKVQCPACSLVYTDETGDQLPKCPRCRSVNERNPPRIF